ncbi:P-loop NTPase fold protein [Vagococcus fluvialis]|uniref:P-loop NTPase fold protein n=1 Tax=Vagococcus fluvialis TaxID=2738 RepID=UPI003D0FFE4F
MLKIDKSESPKIYEDNKIKDAFQSSYENQIRILNHNRVEIVEKLMEESDGRCVYCGQKLGITSPPEIDHFIPKSKDGDVLKWENLFISCAICNHNKGSFMGEILNPSKDDVENMIIQNKYGELVKNPKYNTDLRIDKTIELLKLNRPDLVNMRMSKNFIKSYKQSQFKSHSKILDSMETKARKARTKRILMSDCLSKKDLLNRKEHATIISRSIEYKVWNDREPLVIGIFGEWGDGKSSFMNFINDELKDKNSIMNIKFNASEYDDKSSIWYSLLNSIVKECKKDPIFVFKYYYKSILKNNKLKEIIIKLPIVLFICFMLGILFNYFKDTFFSGVKHGKMIKILFYASSAVPIFNFLMPKKLMTYLKGISNELSNSMSMPNYEKLLGDRELIKQQLEIISKITSSKAKVIYIDELDRCSKETINNFFRAIEVFLPIKDFIYIIGINPSVVYPAVAFENEFLYSSNLSFNKMKKEGKRYIEKYINVPVSLSIPSSYELYIKDMYDYPSENIIEINCNINKNFSENKVNFNSDYIQKYAKLFDLINLNKSVYPRDITRILGSIELKNKPLYSIREDQLTFIIAINYFFPDLLKFFNKNYFDNNNQFNLKLFFTECYPKHFVEGKLSTYYITISESFNEVVGDLEADLYLSLYGEIIQLSKVI